MPRPRAPWWIHLCAASFLGYYGLVTFSAYYLPMGVGFGTARANGLIVASVTSGSDADHAGVQPGDRLVEVNGRRLVAHATCLRSARMRALAKSGRGYSSARAVNSRSRSHLVTVCLSSISVFCQSASAFSPRWSSPSS
jgi:hypothetical protein